MNRYLRFAVAGLFFIGIFFLARNQVAGANPSAGPSLSAREGDEQSVSLPKKDECKDHNKNKDKCGTVKPPPHDVIIPVTGDYSIGGFCTLSVALNDPAFTLDGTIQDPLPKDLPDKVQKVRQGCLLTYHHSGEQIATLPSAAGSTLICFAATPKKEMTVYFYNLYASDAQWTALETSTQDGTACATANASGVYVATFTN